MHPSTPEQPSLSPARAILYGTLVVGSLDMLDALVFFGLRGIRLSSIPQAIAAGLLGKEAFRGGVPTIVLGTALHYFIAFSVVSFYFLLSRRIAFLVRRPVVWGVLYGIGVFGFMNQVVVPLSAAAGGAMKGPVLVNGLLIHMLGVGLPSAVFARKASVVPVTPGAPAGRGGS